MMLHLFQSPERLEIVADLLTIRTRTGLKLTSMCPVSMSIDYH